MDLELRISTLLSQMTVEEKIGQLTQRSGPVADDKGAVRSGMVGSFVLAGSAVAGSEAQAPLRPEELNAFQRVAVEESRLKIPLLFARDVIHGFRTVFPIPLAQSATWSPELVEQASYIAASEARSQGVRWVFAPMVDVARDPRWGRVAEGYGEDPFLTSAFAAAAVRGFQRDLHSGEGVLACAKHFAAYGAVEGGREYNTVDISERTLRETYLPPFLAAVSAGVRTMMAAFNEIGGVPATADRRLLQEILRDEWRFTGAVVSDWNAVAELMFHGVAANAEQAGLQALAAGIDIDMVSECYLKGVLPLVNDDPQLQLQLDTAVARVLRLKFEVGLFDDPYVDESVAPSGLRHSEYLTLAREIAGRSMVLLENHNQLLPLKHSLRTVALVGPLAQAQGPLLGTWTLDGRSDEVVSVATALASYLGPGCEIITDAETGSSIPRYDLRRAEVIIACLGEHPTRSGEGASLVSPELPPGQLEYLHFLKSSGRPVVAVIFAGRPLILTELLPYVDALLYAWHPGSEGGHAVTDVLFGVTPASGKLTMSFPRSIGQIPIYYNQRATGRPPLPEEVRWVSQYIDESSAPLYPFGYGLTYTSWNYENLRCSHSEIPLGESLQIAVTVSNTGLYAGREIIRIFVRDLLASVTRPLRELKAFCAVDLAAGDSVDITLELATEQLAFFNAGGWAVEPGKFQLIVGPPASRSSTELSTEFTVVTSNSVGDRSPQVPEVGR